MTHEQNDDWQAIMAGIREIQDWFPDGVVFIGGIAVFLHSTQLTTEYGISVEVSHDADFFISMADYADLRDIEEVTSNKRLSKHQIIKNNVDFDVYVENHNDLAVPYSEAQAHSIVIDGIRVASLGHLLILKLEAFKSRKGSQKGAKDARDLVKIMLGMTDEDISLAQAYMTEGRIELLESASRSSAFDELSCKNKHQARLLRDAYDRVVKHMNTSNASNVHSSHFSAKP